MLLGANLTKEIGHELYRYVTLLDPACNQFEIIVDKKNDFLCFSHGLIKLHRAYALDNGAWITLIQARPQLFVIKVHNRQFFLF